MPVRKGTISSPLLLDGFNIAYTINSFIIANKNTGNTVVTVYIRDEDDVDVAISAIGFTLAECQAYVRNIPIRVMPNWSIYIDTDASIDYYFSID
jgi:hypothetical protein